MFHLSAVSGKSHHIHKMVPDGGGANYYCRSGIDLSANHQDVHLSFQGGGRVSANETSPWQARATAPPLTLALDGWLQ